MSVEADQPPEDLDDLVRRVDPDRWLSSRLIADPQARADAIAIYAFDHELARAPKVASNPLLGEIRLTWWREVLDEAFEGRAIRRHPTALALAEVIARRGLLREPLETMIDARYRELEPTPVEGEEAVLWARETAGAAARLVVAVLGAAEDAERAQAASALWAVARRRVVISPDDEARLRNRARGLSVRAFPAGAHGALARLYGRSGEVSDLSRRWRITLASLTGRI